MHVRGLALLTLFLSGTSRRSFRVDDSRYDVQQHNNLLTETLKVTAVAREALLPGGLPKALLPHRDPQAGRACGGQYSAAARSRIRLGCGLPRVLKRREFTRLTSAAGFAGFSSAATATAPLLRAQPGVQLASPKLPSASFGLELLDDDTMYRLTRSALDAGYRNFFTAVITGGGKGFARAVRDSGVPREDLFICGSMLGAKGKRADTKSFNAGLEATRRGCAQTFEAADGLDYLDMIMIDFPGLTAEAIRGQWAALEETRAAGKSRLLGVSNFTPSNLDAILATGKGVPAVNQLPHGVGRACFYEENRYFSGGGGPAKMIAENRRRGVPVQAWSPLRAALASSEATAACADVGRRYGKTAAQVALRFIVDTGASFTTRAQTQSHFEESLDIFDFKLKPSEVAMLAKL